MRRRGLTELRHEGHQLYPNNVHLRQQWVEKTLCLELTGRHARFTGGFKRRESQ
jgi:hypothetical protein